MTRRSFRTPEIPPVEIAGVRQGVEQITDGTLRVTGRERENPL
jgi:hypothetical protein